MVASAISSLMYWLIFTVKGIWQILVFLWSIVKFSYWHVVEPIIYWVHDRCRHNYTPYKGEGMVQGKFKCSNCGNRWSSGRSWANTGQKCKFCLIMVYPCDQRPLQPMTDRIDAEEKKPHIPELCERCITLGCNCRNARKIA